MANEATVRKSTLAIKKEATFNTDPVVTSANVIRVSDFDLDGEYDQESYTEIRNSKDGTPKLRGAGKAPGNISINMRAAITEGDAPEGDQLFEGAFGLKEVSTADTVGADSTTELINVSSGLHFNENDVLACIIPTATTFTTDSGSTTSVIELTSVTGLSIGDIVQVPNGDGSSLIEATEIVGIDPTALNITVSPVLSAAPDAAMTVKKASIEFTRISGIATNALSISPALSTAPDQHTDLRAGVTYKFTLDELPSYWIDLWRGDVIHEQYGGNKVESMEINFETGKVVVPKFGFGGVYFDKELASYGLGTPSFSGDLPVVAKQMVLTIGGTSHRCDKLGFKITNTIYNDMDLTTDGIGDKLHTGRTVDGSFSELFRSLAVYTAFKNDTNSTAVVVCGLNGKVTTGKAIALIIPAMRFSKVPIKAENDVYKYDVTYEAQNGLAGSEDCAVLSFL